MADVDPNCPRCSGPVFPDWDWCERCGYDPEGLKPVGWSPAPPPEPEPAKRRRSHRNKAASRTKVNAMAGAAAPAESWPSPIARFSPEPTRPPAPVPAPVAASARAAAAAPPDAAPRPPVVTGAIDLRTPVEPPSRREPRRIRPARRGSAVAAPAPAPSPGPAPVTARPVARPAATTGTTVFDLPPSRLELGLAGLLGLGAIAMAYVGLSSAPSIAAGSVLNGLATGIFIVICLGIAGLLGFQAYALIKVQVVIDERELVAKNRLGRPRRVPVDEIFSVTSATRRYDIGFGVSRTVEMPYVQVTDGAGFWIDALAGRDGDDPAPDQQAVLRQITQIVARHRVVPVLPDLPA